MDDLYMFKFRSHVSGAWEHTWNPDMWKAEAEDLRFSASLGYIMRLKSPIGHFASQISNLLQ